MRVRFSLASVLAWRARPRCRSQPPQVSCAGALAVGPTHGGGGGPHWTVTVTWLSRSMRRDTTVAMRKLFFFFFTFSPPHVAARGGRSRPGTEQASGCFIVGAFLPVFFSFFTVIRRRRRGGGIRRDRVWTFARRSLFARRRWVVNVPDSYVSGLTYIDDRTSTKLYTTMVLLLQRS